MYRFMLWSVLLFGRVHAGSTRHCIVPVQYRVGDTTPKVGFLFVLASTGGKNVCSVYAVLHRSSSVPRERKYP